MMQHELTWWRRVTLVFNPNVRQAQAGDILVGLGNSLDSGQAGVALNGKYKSTQHYSVTSYVMAADVKTVSEWRERLPKGVASIQRVVMEDLSFDSCFSLLLFVLRLQHDEPELTITNLNAWCRYVSRWNEGFTREGRPLTESMAALVTVLGHTYLDFDEEDRRSNTEPALFAEGANVCLDLIWAAFTQQTAPELLDFSKLEHSKGLARARAHLLYEWEQYRLALQHGKSCQLSVPLAGSGRSILVDALFIEERNPSGVLKVFARNDQENTWTRRGFDVLGIYRPLEVGTGWDMTISTTPESGLTLPGLWRELEKLEEERWGMDRPRKRSPVGDSAGQYLNIPDQPWWDDYGKYTIIRAPKKVEVNNLEVLGSKLDWYRDVLPTVWSLYSPIPSKHLIYEERTSPLSKRLCYYRWHDRPRGDGGIGDKLSSPKASTTSMANCPTFRAWLKAQSSPGVTIRSPFDLPSEQSYHELVFEGGILVLHRAGVTAFEDWTNTPLEIDAINSIFNDLAQASARLIDFHGKKPLEEALEYQSLILKNPKSVHLKQFEVWKKNSWELRAEALKVSVSVLNHADPWPLNEFRTLLAKEWGINEQRDETLRAIDRIDHVTTEIVADFRDRRAKVVQAIGSGLAVGIIFKEVVETLKEVWVASSYEWQLELIRQFVPVEIPKELEKISHNLEVWDWATLVALLVGLACGVIVYLTYGTKPHEG